jgi:hypothetical protein
LDAVFCNKDLSRSGSAVAAGNPPVRYLSVRHTLLLHSFQFVFTAGSEYQLFNGCVERNSRRLADP